jgi:secondary thiamine-phosphate synthase enzyme
MIHEIAVISRDRTEMIDITSHIRLVVSQSNIQTGSVTCFVPHTTAGITINENADPDVRRDILSKLNREIPQNDSYAHAEGNSDAHLKASLMGFTLQLLVENQELVLGPWQAVYFCEFDGPRTRRLLIKAVSHA